MANVFWIAIGGAFGSVLRFALAEWVTSLAGGKFPLGILVVNVIGCAAIGVLTGLGQVFMALRPEIQLGLIVGVLGGFTTFSSFAIATHRLSVEGEIGLAIANVLLSNILGMAAVWAGYLAARRWVGA